MALQADGKIVAAASPSSDENRDFAVVRYEGDPLPVACGNGVVEAGEECDDGNTTDGDGCGAACEEEDADGGDGGGGCSLIR